MSIRAGVHASASILLRTRLWIAGVVQDGVDTNHKDQIFTVFTLGTLCTRQQLTNTLEAATRVIPEACRSN